VVTVPQAKEFFDWSTLFSDKCKSGFLSAMSDALARAPVR
jgi:hypothetical protein